MDGQLEDVDLGDVSHHVGSCLVLGGAQEGGFLVGIDLDLDGAADLGCEDEDIHEIPVTSTIRTP